MKHDNYQLRNDIESQASNDKIKELQKQLLQTQLHLENTKQRYETNIKKLEDDIVDMQIGEKYGNDDDDDKDIEKKDDKYKCSKCGIVLANTSSLNRHMKRCNGCLRSQCPTCKVIFKTPQAKYYHTKNGKCEQIT